MHRVGLLFLIIVVMPLLEISLFIQVGGIIGVLPTIALIILTAVIGVSLMRLQGVMTLTRIREKLNRDEIPADDMIEGLLLLVAGALLLAPGFFTDLLGFALLIPLIRRPLARRILQHLTQRQRRGGNRHSVIINGEVVDPGADNDQYPDPHHTPQRLKGHDRGNYN